MSFFLWKAGDNLGVAAPRQVLRAAEVPAFAQVGALLQRCEALAAAEAARVEAAEAEAHARGLAAGRAEGAQQMADALAAQLAALARDAGAAVEAQREEVATLALALAHKLVGELPEPERSLRLAAEAARELRPARVLRLQVAPDLAAPLAAALTAHAGTRHPLAEAEVQADAALGAGQCRLVTDQGRADASPAARLARVGALWGVAP